jgi:hypothetical protein
MPLASTPTENGAEQNQSVKDKSNVSAQNSVMMEHAEKEESGGRKKEQPPSFVLLRSLSANPYKTKRTKDVSQPVGDEGDPYRHSADEPEKRKRDR